MDSYILVTDELEDCYNVIIYADGDYSLVGPSGELNPIDSPDAYTIAFRFPLSHDKLLFARCLSNELSIKYKHKLTDIIEAIHSVDKIINEKRTVAHKIVNEIYELKKSQSEKLSIEMEMAAQILDADAILLNMVLNPKPTKKFTIEPFLHCVNNGDNFILGSINKGTNFPWDTFKHGIKRMCSRMNFGEIWEYIAHESGYTLYVAINIKDREFNESLIKEISSNSGSFSPGNWQHVTDLESLIVGLRKLNYKGLKFRKLD